MVTLSLRSLSTAGAMGPMGAHILYVYGSRDDLNIVQTELGALGDDLSVESNHGATIVVEAVSIATLLIRIQIHTAELDST